MSELVMSPYKDRFQADLDTILSSPRMNTPSKHHSAEDAWKSCYELTDVVASMYPSTLRIPYPYAIPRESYNELSESQRKAVCWMWYNLFDAGRGGVLADSLENNLSQVCQFLNGLCLPRLVFKCLIIVPTQTLDLWISAMLQLAPRVRSVEFSGPQRARRFAQVVELGGVVVTSYGVAMNDIDLLAPALGSEEEDKVWDVIVFDQAERLKDPTSKTNSTLSRLQGNINLLLTSHAILHTPKDLYSLFDFACEADIFGSAAAFKERFEVPLNREKGKRADDTDRQLAALARAQLADLIDSQYWQNWQDLLTPGGQHLRQENLSVAPTPTPHKNARSQSALTDLASTPSFARTRTAPRSTAKKTTSNTSENANANIFSTPSFPKKTATRKTSKKTKPLIPEVINLDEDESPMGIDQLESSLSNLLPRSTDTRPMETPKRSETIDLTSTPVHRVIEDELATPTRRTPIRNTFFANHTPIKTPSNGEDNTLVAKSTLPAMSASPLFSPQIVMDRQRISFGRISLLAENESSNKDEEEPDTSDFLVPTPSKASSALFKGSSGTSVTGTPQREKKPSLVAKTWPSAEVFLRQREAFAQKLFEELNAVIFSSRLPTLTLVWRAMKNCAGIYHLKDSSITLSKTLLTNSSRLASTMAHEMAHAATHLLDECPNDRHGPVWQKWARIGHARYPTVVTGEVYHNYCSQNQGPSDGAHA